jgi:hypothetical protein
MMDKFLAAAAAFLLLAGVAALANTALAYPGDDTSTSGMMDDSKYMFGNTTVAADNGTKMMGMITSIQNNEQGQPAWLVGGHWKLSYTSDDSTGTAATGSNLTSLDSLTTAGNSTGNTTTAASDTISNITDFHAMLHMVMLDGSAMHPHEISNFTQLEDAATLGNSTTIVGTSTVTMREGPVSDVGTRISISQDNVIKIELDPAALENHFGDTPIYGLVMNDDMMMGMHMGTMTSGMMEDRHMNGSMWEDGGNTTTSTMEDMWK